MVITRTRTSYALLIFSCCWLRWAIHDNLLARRTFVYRNRFTIIDFIYRYGQCRIGSSWPCDWSIFWNFLEWSVELELVIVLIVYCSSARPLPQLMWYSVVILSDAAGKFYICNIPHPLWLEVSTWDCNQSNDNFANSY